MRLKNWKDQGQPKKSEDYSKACAKDKIHNSKANFRSVSESLYLKRSRNPQMKMILLLLQKLVPPLKSVKKRTKSSSFLLSMTALPSLQKGLSRLSQIRKNNLKEFAESHSNLKKKRKGKKTLKDRDQYLSRLLGPLQKANLLVLSVHLTVQTKILVKNV